MSGGGGKGGSSSSTVSIPPEVLARYNQVNARAEQTATQPFTAYSNDPSAFVAPLTPTQQAGIANTNAAAGLAQPWYQQAGGAAAQGYGQGQKYLGAATQAGEAGFGQGQNYLQAATNYAQAGGLGVTPQQYSSGQIAQYMNPFAQQVIGGTLAPLQQQQQQDLQNLKSANIKAGAFGGDRAAIADAVLRGQQEMATGNVVSGLLSPMYNQAQQEFNTQQGVNLAAQQANRQAIQQTGQALGALGQQGYAQTQGLAQLYGNLGQQGYGMGTGLAGTLGQLGTGAQQAALTGAQAQLSAGQQQQQTQQAGLTALYNQFLQQQSYPFQVTQFLANIAEGTGALSGSTTTSQQSGGFFSDERVKEDIEPIGETYDGQKIIKFRYKGDKGPKQIGLSAQDVEKHHPHAVGDWHGIKTVDYDEATKNSAHRGHFYAGGLASMGGAALDTGSRENFDIGGSTDQSALMAQLGLGRQTYNPYGLQPAAQGAGIVPSQRNIPGFSSTPRSLMTAQPPRPAQSGLSQAVSFGKDVTGLVGSRGTKDPKTGDYTGGSGLAGLYQTGKEWLSDDQKARGGRTGFDDGGDVGDQFKPDNDDLLKHQSKLNIPNDNPQAKLATANAPSGGGGGLGGMLGGAGALFTGISNLADLFADGGLVGDRPHHATQGRENGDDSATVQAYNVPADPVSALNDINDQANLPSGFMPRLAQIESGMGQKIYNKDSKASGWFQHLPSTAQARGIDPLDFQQSAADAAKMALENRSYLRQNAGIQDPTGAHLYLAHQQGPGGAAALLQGGDQTAIDALTPIYAKSIKDPDRARSVATAAVLNNGGNPNITAQDFAQRIMAMYGGVKMPSGGVGGGKKQLAALDEGALGAIERIPGVGSLVKSQDQGGLSEQTKLALLSGLGGMLASPNRSLLGALGSGITSGVETYQGMGGLGVQQQQANTASRSADVLNAARLQAMAKGSLFLFNGREVVMTKDGLKSFGDLKPTDEILYGSEAAAAAQRVGATPVSGSGSPYQPTTTDKSASVEGLSPKPAQADTTQYNFLGDAGKSQLQKDYNDVFKYGDAQTRTNALAKSAAAEDKINTNAEDARRAGDTLNQMTDLVLKAPKDGPMSLGPLSGKVTGALDVINDLARKFGVKDENGQVIQIMPEEIGQQTAQAKIAALQQFQSAMGSGQHSLAALQAAQQIVANPKMSREAAIELLAGTQISRQRDIDLQNYYNEAKDSFKRMYGNQPQAYVLAHNILNQFNKDNSFDRYRAEKEALVDFYRKGTYKNDDGSISTITAPKDENARALIDQYYQQKFKGAKNIYRYSQNQ